MKKVLFSLVSSSRALGVALVKKGLSKKRRQNRAMHRIELPACGKKFLAASLLLLVATPQLTQVRAYAQAFEQPATVATVPQNFSLESASANIQTVAGLGAGAFQGINITSDKLPSGTATDSQSNSQSQAPTVPPAPGMPQLDMVTGLVPVVAGVTLTPDVPVLPTTGPATNSDAANQVTTSISAPTSANSETSSLIGQPAAAVDAGSTTTITAQAAPAADLSDSSTTIMAVSQPVESSSTAAVITQSNQGAELASSTSDSSTVAAISSSDSTSSAPDPGNVTITTAPGDSSSASANNVAPQAAQTTDSTSVASAIAGTSQLTQTPQVTLTTNSLFSSGTSLDLSSNQATFTAPIDQPVFISVGGTIDANGSVTGGSLVQVNPGQMLTASQYIAVTQVVQHGAQNIVLTSSGSAEGGSFTLFAGQTGSLSNLVLPSNVALDTVGFTSSNPFSVTGAASILGSLYALQSTDSTASVLDFGSLTVGGLLTGDMAQMPVLSTIMPGYFSSSGLVLNAFGGLQNYGTISTAGTLTITSNADIGNAGYLSGSSVALNAVSNITNTGNIFASAGNVDLNSVSGNFINSGTINSALSNVNFNTAQAASIANINLTNAGGSILANNGSINFRTTDFMDKADLKITGGSLSANTVELNGGRGEVEVNVDNLGGTVNSSAYVVKLAAASDITIGNTTANGDPTIVSTTGNVTLAGNQITGGAPLSVIAYGDIITAPGITIQTNGGEVFMASGVNIQDTGATWTITGPASPNGGLLDLRGVTTFSTSGATGGNVTLIAYDGGNIDSGRVLFTPTTTISTAGTAGANGNVKIIAEDANSAGLQSIITGTIDTRGAGNGTIGTGSVLLAAARLPDTVNVTVDKVSGAATGLNQFVPGGGLPRDINVNGDIITRGAAVSLIAGNATSANGNILITGQVDNRMSSTGAGVGDGGSFTVLQNSANTFVVGGATVNGIGAASRAIQTQAGTGGGNGGSVNITNNGPGGITAKLGSVATPIIDTRAFGTGSGGSFILSAPAGPITLTSTGNAVNAQAAGGNQDGGTIQIVGQTFTASGNPNLNAFGSGSGSGGTVTVQSTQAGNNITVGTTSPDIRVNLNIFATGAAGTANLSAGGNLVVNTANLVSTTGTNQKGATLNLNSGLGGAGTTQIIGSLDVSGNGTGDGGTINISTNSGTAFTVSGGPNGVTGTLKANSGATGGDGGTINIKNSGTGGITVTNAAAVSVAPLANGAGGTLILDAAAGATPGVVSLAGGTYDASALGGNNNGGIVTVKGSQTIGTGAGPVTILADASGTGNGGTVQLIATAAGSTATIGNSAGQFILDARGGSVGSASGNGGTVEARQGGNLTVTNPTLLDSAARGTNGNGGTYILEAGSAGPGNLSIAGSLNAQGGGAGGAGTGKGGVVQLTSNSATTFLVNGGPTTNGIDGTVGASGGATSGAGGSVSIINRNTGGITLTNAGDVTAAAPTNGNGGTIILNATAGGPALSGNITIPTGTLDVAGAGATGNGGTIDISGRDFVSPGAGPLTLQANASGTGNGGIVRFTTTGTTSDLTVGGGGDNSLNVSATGGSVGSAAGDGGLVSVNAGRNLTVNNAPGSLNSNPLGLNGKGANITLSSGNLAGGDLFVNMPLDASGIGTGGGGSISLTTNSASTFNIGTGSVNPGVNGALTANGGAGAGAGGGTIAVVNKGAGGINIGATTNISTQASAAGGPGGAITLDAGGGTLTIPVTGAAGSPTATLDASANGATTAGGGTITLNANVINVPGATPLNLDVSGAGSGNAGTVNITKGSGNVDVSNTPGGFTIAATSGDGAIINIKAPGDINFDPSAVTYLPTAPNGNGACINLDAGQNLYVTDSLDANGRGTGNGGCIILSSNSPTATPFTIGAGAVTNGVDGTLSAASGPAGGQGGIIRVFDKNADANPLTGGIVVTNTTNLTVSASGGKGGEITLNSTDGPVNFVNGSNVNANAGGGNFAGGLVNITGTQVLSGGAAALNVTANGSGTGNGGTVNLTTTSNTIGDVNLGGGAGQVKLSAQSGAGATGNGGTVSVSAARNLVADGTQILVNSLASSGTGGTINLSAGTQGPGNLQVTGNINANGTGNGNGGAVNIKFPEPNAANPLLIGAVGGATQSFVSGSILAQAPGIGVGGTINIQNTTANAPLNIDFAGTGAISANSAQGKFGDVILATAGGAAPTGNESITVKPVAGNVGSIGGFITAIGTSVDITTRANNARIDVGTVTGTNGIVNLVSDQGGVGRVSVGEGHVARATGDITISAQIFEDNGLVTTSNPNGRIDVTSPDNLLVTGEGTVSTTGAGNTVIRFAAAPTFNLTLDNNLNIRPTNDAGKVIFEAPGTGGSVIVPSGRNILINDGGDIQISTNNLVLGQLKGVTTGGSSISAVAVPGRVSNIVVDSGAVGAQDLNIQSDGLFNTLAAMGTGATINIGPTNGTSDGKNLNFTGANTTLNLNGGDVDTHVRSTPLLTATTSIAPTFTLQGQQNICIGLDGGTALTPATLVNNGIIQTSGTLAGTKIIVGPEDAAAAGPNFVAISGGTLATPGQINLTGNPANGFVGVHALDDTLTFTAGTNQSINSGTGASSSTQLGGGSGVFLAAGANVSSTGGSKLDVFTNALTTRASASITNLQAGSPVNIGAGTITGCAGNFVVTGPLAVTTDGTAATAAKITSNNGQINFTPSSGSNLSFANSGTPAALNINSGTADVVTNTTNATTSIAANTTLNVTGNQLTNNVDNGTFANAGQVNAVKSTGAAGQINVLSTSDLTMPNAGNLSVDPTVAGAGGTIVIRAGAPGNPLGVLNIGNGTALGSTINANGLTNGDGGTVTIAAGQVNVAPGTPLTINANAAGTGNGGTISVSANDPVNGNVTTGGGSTNLNLIARGGTTNGNGGTVNIIAGNNVSITGAASNIDVSPAGANGNGGTVNITASNSSGTGALTLSTNINAAGTGVGNGGTVRLTNNSSQTLLVNQPISVAAGTTGNGGQIFIKNYGNGAANGGIDVQTILTANASGNGNGGTVSLDACPPAGVAGNVNIGVTPFSANGAGVGNGGLVQIKGAQIIDSAASAITLTANAGTVGSGGTVELAAKAATGDISFGGGVGAFTASARGGTTSGNGGTITATAGRNISSPGAGGSISVAPFGGNSNGGNITLSAGNAAPGIVSIGSALIANGSGSGTGGNIVVEYNDPTASNANRFVIGGAPGTSGGVLGVVAATGGATGAGGNITFRNRDGVTGNDLDLFQDLRGTVSVGGSGGVGNITFNQNNASNTLVDVRGPVGQGNLIGRVNASENDVFINPQAINTTLTVGTVLARNGNAEVAVNCNDNSQVIIPIGSSVVSNTGEARVTGHTITNNGLIQGQTNVKLGTDILNNNAIITAVTGDVTVNPCNPGDPLVVNLIAGSQMNANNGNIRFSNINGGGPISVTGAGNVGTNPNGQISFGDGVTPNTVNMTVNQAIGCVTGIGTTVNVLTATGDLQVGPFTSSGVTTFRTNGVGADIITCGDIDSGAGNLTLQAGTGANANVQLKNNVTSTGLLTINSGAGAGSNVTLDPAVTVSGGTTAVNTPQLALGAGSTLRATTGDLDVQSNAPGNALTVNLAAGSTIVSTNADVGFNRTTTGAITMTGGLGTLQSGGASPQVFFNGGNGVNAVSVDVNNIIGCAEGSGSTYSILTQNGDLNVGTTNTFGATSVRTNGVGSDIITCGNINSTTGPITMQAGTGPDADVKLNNTVFTPGALNITSSGGLGSDVTVATGVTISGAITVTTPSLVVDGTGLMRSLGGADLQISSNAPGNVLNVALNGPTATLLSTSGNVNFNTPAATGAVTVTGGPANGVITANSGNGTVNLNGGLANAVNVNVNQINGCITGTGTPFNVTVAQASVFGDVRFGPITSNGDLNLNSPADIGICGDITSNTGSINVTTGTGAANRVSFANGADLFANQNVNINTPNLNLTGGNNTVNATTGNVNVQSNTAGAALTVNMGAGSQINANAAGTGMVNFNPTIAGNINITGGPADGLISAGNDVTYQGGTVAVNVGQIIGCNESVGAGVTTASITTATGDLRVGPFTSSGNAAFTANGVGADIITCGDINSGAGNLTLQAGTGANANVQLKNNVTSTGLLTINSGAGAGSNVTLDPAVTVSGGTTAVNTPQLALGAGSTLRASTGDLDVQSNAPGSALTVNLAAGSTIVSTNSDVGFNRTTAGAITMTGGLGTLQSGGASPQVIFNGGNGVNAVNVDVNNIIGCAEGSGSTYSILTQNGDLNVGTTNTSGATSVRTNGVGSDIITCGDITSTNGPVTMQAGTGPDADVKLNNNVTSGGALNITSSGGLGSDVTVATGATISGATTTVTTPSLVVDGTGIVRSTGAGADLQISSNAPGNVLNVALNGPTATLQSNTGNVNFNTPAATGAITVTGGPANGVITANAGNGNVNLNGGLANAVNVNVNQINGCIAGTGTPFNVTVAQASILGDVRFGPITSNGDLNLSSPADIGVCGDLTSNTGSVNLTTANGPANRINFAANADIFANQNVTLTTPNLNLTGGNNTVNATTGNVNVQSNAAGAALTVNMGAGSQINANAPGTGMVNFNPTTAGNINITGGPANGLISAGDDVTYQGGTVAVNVGQIIGCNESVGAGVTTASITTATGDLRVGPFTSSGNAAFTANGVGADIITCGDINSGAGNLTLQAGTGANANVQLKNNVTSTGLLTINSGAGAGSNVTLDPAVTVSGGTTAVNTPQLALGAGSTLRASTGDLDVQSNAPGSALTVNLAAGSTIVSTNADVGFNRTTAGAITMTGGLGTLQSGGASPQVIFNGGNGVNAVNVDVNNIIGCAEGSGSTYSILTQNGDLNVGTTNTSGATSVRTNGVGSDIITCGDITSTNGPVTMQAGTGPDADVKLNNNVTSGGALNITSSGGLGSDVTVATGATISGATTTVTTPSLVVDGTGIVRSTGAGADLQISSNAPGNVLNVALNGPTATLQSNTGNVNFNTPAATGAITVTGGPANGVITANAGNGNVNLNGGLANAVNVNVNQINGCIAGTGTPFNVTVAQASILGDVRFGPITSNGDLNLSSPADIGVCGDLTSNTGSVNLTTANGPANRINFAANADIFANQNVTLTTPNLNLTGGNNTVNATTGNVNVQSNAAGAALTVNMGAGSQINANAAGTGMVNFNPTTAGNINITGGPANGLISAGDDVTYQGGTVAVNVGQIIGCNESVGAGVTTASITTATGDLNVGPFTSSGNAAFTANGVGADIITCGDINSGAGNLTLQAGTGANANVQLKNNVTSTGLLTINSGAGAGANVTLDPAVTVSGGTTALNTPQLSTGANSTLRATTGDLTVNSNDPGNVLNVNLGALSTISSIANVNFNNPGAATEGPLNIQGAATSLIQAVDINYNVGPNPLVVNVGQLIGCNEVNTATGNPTSIAFTTQTGIINFCKELNTSSTTGNGGPITINANGGAVDLGGNSVIASGGGAAGNGGAISITAAGGITGGGNIVSNGSATGSGNGGAINLTAPGTNNITVTTIQADGGLTGGNGGSITTNSSNLSVTGIGPGGNSISANGPAGNGGTVSITTTSTNPFVAGNPFPNGTASGISANGGNGNGGAVMIASDGATVNPGVTVSANGSGGAGGVVTFDANNPANPNPVININGTVTATGTTPGTGVVGLGTGPGQNLIVNAGPGAVIGAGQQVTIGNIDPLTGLPAGAPAGNLFVSPFPVGPFPSGPFQTPNVVINGNLVPPPPPIVPTPVGNNNGGGFNLLAYLLGLNALNGGPLDAQLLGLRIPTDLTRVWSRGKLNQDEASDEENEEIAQQKNLGKQCGLIEGSLTYASTFDQGELSRLASEKITIAENSGGTNFKLDEGNVLFAPDKAITVETQSGVVHIPAGAVAFIMAVGSDVAIYDLHQNSQEAMQVVTGKKLVTLDPGRLLVLTEQQTRDFEKIVGRCRCIGYRNPKEEDINENIKAFGMDFSLPSIISNVQPLKQMLGAQSGPAKAIMDKILKNSALLMQLTASAGPFKDGN